MSGQLPAGTGRKKTFTDAMVSLAALGFREWIRWRCPYSSGYVKAFLAGATEKSGHGDTVLAAKDPPRARTHS